MIKLLVIADDFTGALDTGVQFAGKGVSTKIVNQMAINKEQLGHICTEVLVIDVETRHLKKEEAYSIVYGIVKEAKAAGVPYIYKKTDSGLRGNVGKELEAALDASGERYLTFIPAFPSMNRITVNGIHYVDGKPIHESAFGKDPFEPVTSSVVSDLFDRESVCVSLYKPAVHYLRPDKKEIGIFDASSEQEIEAAAKDLFETNALGVMAGCAGFASVLVDCLGLCTREIHMPRVPERLFIVCGSVNDISKKQIEYAEAHGFFRIAMTPRQQLEPEYLLSPEGREWLTKLKVVCDSGKTCVVETGISKPGQVTAYLKEHRISLEQARLTISRTLGSILKELLQMGMESTLMIIGGDTLVGFVEQMDCREITIVSELEQGTVLSSMEMGEKVQWIVSKSGGFGGPELLIQIDKKIRKRWEEKHECDEKTSDSNYNGGSGQHWTGNHYQGVIQPETV